MCPTSEAEPGPPPGLAPQSESRVYQLSDRAYAPQNYLSTPCRAFQSPLNLPTSGQGCATVGRKDEKGRKTEEDGRAPNPLWSRSKLHLKAL